MWIVYRGARKSSWPGFFSNDTATTEIYTLSLHDALPIYPEALRRPVPGRRPLRLHEPLRQHRLPAARAHEEERVGGQADRPREDGHGRSARRRGEAAR